jgi:hypothetical protein
MTQETDLRVIEHRMREGGARLESSLLSDLAQFDWQNVNPLYIEDCIDILLRLTGEAIIMSHHKDDTNKRELLKKIESSMSNSAELMKNEEFDRYFGKFSSIVNYY